MAQFLYHSNPGRNGSLNPGLWVSIAAADANEAIEAALKRESINRPETVYLSVGSSRYKNGTPICVCKYSIKWE